MTKESAIQKAQQESLAKFARERDVFIANPELKLKKENLTKKILLKLAAINELEYELQYLKDQLTGLAIDAINLEEKGIYWAEKDFSVCHAAKRKNEKAMLALVFPDRLTEYEEREKELKEFKKHILKNIDPIYLDSKPSIKHKTAKETPEYDYE